jgi:hypothetical protein
MNDITLLSIITASFTFIIILLKQAYKSKCDSIDCLCFKISRNIKTETEEHKFDIEHNIRDNDLENLKQSIK